MNATPDTASLDKVKSHLRAERFNKLYIGGRFVDAVAGEASEQA